MLQWVYVTANTCLSPGYRDVAWPASYSDCAGDGGAVGWVSSYLPDCGDAFPEEFWNCADIAIVPDRCAAGVAADACGVCGGDDSSCTDCAGVVNGGATLDCAGACNGGATLDCAGVCNGPAVFDQCGVCSGDDSSCIDCAGVVNGGAARDCAGACNGRATTDCAGVCNGAAALDACGVCGGSANSAAECTSVQFCCSWAPYTECGDSTYAPCLADAAGCSQCNGQWLSTAELGDSSPPPPPPAGNPAPSAAPAPTPPPAPVPAVDPYTSGWLFTTASVGSSVTRLREFTAALARQPAGLDAAMLAVQADGGVASGVVSEGQGYGLLLAGGVLGALDATAAPAAFAEASAAFRGYFLGWQRMCVLSASGGNCQDDEGYQCGAGSYPCLPHWKFDGNLQSAVGTGAAPDGDEDAMAGMIMGVLALEAAAATGASPAPTWLDDVAEWAHETCKQFYLSNTVSSPSGNHRIVKLGSCWGGWGADGQNPSYHAPGAYRLCRAYMEGRGDTSLTAGWNTVIETTYKALDAVQCAANGLVPNWARVSESADGKSLIATTNPSPGSGTPAGEYGAEAARTVWRVTLDYHLFPAEAAEGSRRFLSPISAHLDRIESNGQWANLEVTGGCLVDSIHSSWQWNAFMSGPTFTALTAPPTDDGLDSVRQAAVLESAANRIAGFGISHYYSGSWVAIATLTLNGDFARFGSELLLGTPGGNGGDLVTPATSTQPRAAPTVRPTAAPTLVTSIPTVRPTLAPTQPRPAPTPATLIPTVQPTLAPTPATPVPTLATAAPTRRPSTSSTCTDPAGAWQQCGGEGWSGATCCGTGYYCESDPTAQGVNRFYHQCRPGSAPVPAPAPVTPAPTPPLSSSPACINPAGSWQQCGGEGWSGTTCCSSGLSCEVENRWHHQCRPVRRQRMVRGRRA